MSKSSDKVANTFQSFMNQIHPGDMYTTHRNSSVKVFPEHLKTDPKKLFNRVPLGCRNDSDRLDGVNHMTVLETIIKVEDTQTTPTLKLFGESSDNSSVKRSLMKP